MLHHHSHDHANSSGADTRYLLAALSLIGAFMAGEVIAAMLSGSIALLADAGHMLTDAGALAGSIWAARLAARPPSDAWTFGLMRAEIIAAAVNGMILDIAAVAIVVDATSRLLNPPPVDGGVVLTVAIAGIAVNGAATWIMTRADRTRLNIRGAFLHILTDLYAFAGTAAAGLVIMLTGWARADAIASLLVAGVMALASWSLLHDAGRILLQATPDQFNLPQVRRHLREVDPHITDVHDLHAWTITSGQPTISAHIVVAEECFATGHAPQTLDQLQACLASHFNVEHATFQLESAAHVDHEHGIHS